MSRLTRWDMSHPLLHFESDIDEDTSTYRDIDFTRKGEIDVMRLRPF